MEKKRYPKILKYVLYAFILFIITLVIAIVCIFLAYKPFIAEYKYNKAVYKCDEIYYNECRNLMKSISAYAPGTDAAKKANHYIKHRLPRDLNIPDSIFKTADKAYSNYKNMKYEQSLSMLKEINKEVPDYEYPYYLFSFIYNYKKEYDSSIKYLKAGILINPDYYDFYLELAHSYFSKGRTLLENGNLKDAKRCFEESLTLYQDISKDPLNESYYPEDYTSTFQEDMQDAKDYLAFTNRKLKIHNK